jgi:hypothetical protein
MRNTWQNTEVNAFASFHLFAFFPCQVFTMTKKFESDTYDILCRQLRDGVIQL